MILMMRESYFIERVVPDTPGSQLKEEYSSKIVDICGTQGSARMKIIPDNMEGVSGIVEEYVKCLHMDAHFIGT